MMMAGGISSQLLGIKVPSQSHRSHDIHNKINERDGSKTQMSALTRNVLGLGRSGYSGLAYHQHFSFTTNEHIPLGIGTHKPIFGQANEKPVVSPDLKVNE
jgi:hypothetical protein